MKKKQNINLTHLSSEKEIEIRFSEVDAMGIVWHGNYVKYIEDSREEFGKKYGLSYLDVYANNYMTPIVKLDINYKKVIKYGDSAIIKITFVESKAAKITFEYEIRRKSDNEIAATASSVQVFMNKDFELELLPPEFFINWKQKHLGENY